MRLLRSFRLVPIPSIVNVAPALALWCVWWLADQMQPAIMGLSLAPVALGLLARFGLQAVLNLTFNKHAQRQWAKDRPYALFALVTVLSMPVVALIFGQDRFAQIALTLFIAFQGLSMLWFVVFSPSDLHRMPNSFARMGVHLMGSQTILAVGHLVLALTSAALIGQGSVMAWVALMSGGAVIYYLLNAWVVVVWMLTQPDDTAHS